MYIWGYFIKEAGGAFFEKNLSKYMLILNRALMEALVAGFITIFVTAGRAQAHVANTGTTMLQNMVAIRTASEWKCCSQESEKDSAETSLKVFNQPLNPSNKLPPK